MPTTSELQARTLVRGEKVKLVDALPRVPAGTRGRIAMANGFTWNRYWVRFDNGQVVGHIDHGNLIRSRDYERFIVLRDREQAEAEKTAAAGPGADDPVASEMALEGGEAVVNGVAIPAYLLERSANARARLTI